MARRPLAGSVGDGHLCVAIDSCSSSPSAFLCASHPAARLGRRPSTRPPARRPGRARCRRAPPRPGRNAPTRARTADRSASSPSRTAALTSSSRCSEQDVSHVPQRSIAPQPMHVGTVTRCGSPSRASSKPSSSSRWGGRRRAAASGADRLYGLCIAPQLRRHCPARGVTAATRARNPLSDRAARRPGSASVS